VIDAALEARRGRDRDDDGTVEVTCAPNDFEAVREALASGLKPEVARSR